MFILLEILCSIFLPPTRKMNFKTFKNITLTFTIFINQPVLKIGKLFIPVSHIVQVRCCNIILACDLLMSIVNRKYNYVDMQIRHLKYTCRAKEHKA